jgi:uncharacterized membrane protein YgcG
MLDRLLPQSFFNPHIATVVRTLISGSDTRGKLENAISSPSSPGSPRGGSAGGGGASGTCRMRQ